MIPQRRSLTQILRSKFFSKTSQSPVTLKHLALKKSTTQFEEQITKLRKEKAKSLKLGRLYDRTKIWEVSFNSNLKDLNSFFHRNLIELIKKQIKGKQKIKVASIGCGTGRAESQIEEIMGDKIELHATGLKLVPAWSKHKNYKKINWHVTHDERMSRELGIGTMDMVFSNLGFHSNNPTGSFNTAYLELSKILKKGGIAILNIELIPHLSDLPTDLKVISEETYARPVKKNGKNNTYYHSVLILKKI